MSNIKKYSARVFYDTQQFMGISFTENEENIVLTSDESGVFNLYSLSIKESLKKQLTYSKSHAFILISCFPNDKRILYTADQGGNELNHLYVLNEDGSSIDITPGTNLKAQFLDWSGNENKFWVLSSERDPKYFDLYRYNINNYDRELVYKNTGEYGLVETISPDCRFVALLKTNGNADSDIYLLDLMNENEEPKLITPHIGEVKYNPQDFSPNSKNLFYLSNLESEYNRVWSYNIDSSEDKLIEEAKWDIMKTYYSKNGKFRITNINVDARTEVTVYNEKGEKVNLPINPEGDITNIEISKSSKYMAFYVNGDTSPSNLYILDIISGKCNKLTNSLSPEINENHLVVGQVIRYESFDGLQIPALLYKPHDASIDNRVPALVYVHGGPGGQTRLGYSGERQFLINQGYAVLAVNNRGSSGYGKTFHHMDDKKHGDVDLKDCIWGRYYLEGLDWIDKNKIAIMGGSYGGYMVAAAMAFEPKAFDAGIDIFGVTNWVRTLKSIPPWWEENRKSLYQELGDPYKEEELLRAKSPLFHANRICRPLLVIQGKNDPRVLQVESDELVEAAKRNGAPVEYIVFPDEGHGFRNKKNRIIAAEAYNKFLLKYLK